MKILIIFAIIAQCVIAVNHGDTAIELSEICAHSQSRSNPAGDAAAERLPLLPYGTNIDILPVSQGAIEKVKKSICSKPSAGESVTLQEFVKMIKEGGQYVSVNDHDHKFLDMVSKHSQPNADLFKVLLNVVEAVANLENDIMGKLLLNDYSENFVLASQIKNALPAEIKTDETRFSSQNYVSGKYDLPLFGSFLLSVANDKVNRFRGFLDSQEKRILNEMKNHQETYDKVVKALLEEIFGNLPWQERLERLKLGYALHQLLASGGKTSRQGRYLRRAYSESLSTQEARLKFFGAYLLGSSYPRPIIRTSIPVGSSEKLLFIDNLGVHLVPKNDPAPPPVGLSSPFGEFQRVFELDREVANDAKKLDKLANLESRHFPYVTPETTAGGLISSCLVGGVVFMSIRLAEDKIRLRRPRVSGWEGGDTFWADQSERDSAGLGVFLKSSTVEYFTISFHIPGGNTSLAWMASDA